MNNHFVIKSAPRVSVQGRHKAKDESGALLGQSKSAGAIFTFAILPNVKTGKLSIDLEQKIDNPWYAKNAKDANLPSNWRNSKVYEKPKISTQEYLELKFDKPEGFLDTSIIDLKEERPKITYLQAFRYFLREGENLVDLDTLEGQILFYAAKKSRFIAPTQDQLIDYPDAEFYITSVNESQERKLINQRETRKAMSLLENFLRSSSSETILQMCFVLRLVSNINELNLTSAELILDQYLQDENSRRENLEQFEKFYNLATVPAKRNIFDAHVLLRTLVQHNILRENRGKVIWPAKRNTSLEEIGKTEEQAIQFLLDKDSQQYVAELKAALNEN